MENFNIKLHNERMSSDIFTEDEKAIITSRFNKRNDLKSFYDKIKFDPSAQLKFLESFMDEDASEEKCEHGVLILDNCQSCLALERKIMILHPTLYGVDFDVSDLFNKKDTA